MKRQHTCWVSGTQDFVFHVTDENKSLAKMNLQVQVLAPYVFPNIQRNMPFPCHFTEIIPSQDTLSMVQRGADQLCTVLHPAVAGLCSALHRLCLPRHLYLLHMALHIHCYIYLSSHLTSGAFIKDDVYVSLDGWCFLLFIKSIIKG